MTDTTQAAFLIAGADIPVTPEEDDFFRELEARAQQAATPLTEAPQVMTYAEHSLHIQTTRGTSFSSQRTRDYTIR